MTRLVTKQKIVNFRLICQFIYEDKADNYLNSYYFDELKFDESWSAIMPVVDKIESLGYQHRVWFNEIGTLREVASGAREDTKLEAVYDF